MDLTSYIRDVPDFPVEGILFKDITPLLADPQALKESVELLAGRFSDVTAGKIVAAEARGFIFGAALAIRMGLGFVPVRKKGKLPYTTTSVTYDLEYGTDTIYMHTDAVSEGETVILIDDLLATGGTAGAMVKLVEQAGAKVAGLGFVVELDFLKGREAFAGHRVESLIHY